MHKNDPTNVQTLPDAQIRETERNPNLLFAEQLLRLKKFMLLGFFLCGNGADAIGIIKPRNIFDTLCTPSSRAITPEVLGDF